MPYSSYKKYFDLEKLIIEIKAYMPRFNEKSFLRAFSFAEKAHRGQLRKDGVTPYIVHPVETVRSLVHLHADEDILISAILHDVPEDTKHEIHEVKQKFGPKVAFLVDAITKLSKVHYLHNMPERQVESLKKLFLHSAKDPRVILIKLADRLHNMKTLSSIKDPEKKLRIARETLEIYVPIANLLGIQDLKSQLEDYCFKYLFPTEYRKLKAKLENTGEKHKEGIKDFIKIVKKGLKKNSLKAEVYGRKKGLYSIYKKICSQGKTIDDIDDRVGVRVITDTVAQCYQLLGVIHDKFTPKMGRFKDYIANPKVNGYQSLHTSVFGSDGVVTEVQIRTHDMDTEAGYGIASHFFYKKPTKANKNKNLIKDKRSSWVNKILEMEKVLKSSDDFMENLKLDIFQDRIFVFTPKGATIDLPRKATAIDFSYAIHTEVGNHAAKAEINGEMKPITSQLKTGDVVNIITLKKISPAASWLPFAKTNFAKNKICLYLKKISKVKKLKEGYKILQKELDIARLGTYTSLNLKKIRNSLASVFGKNFDNWDDIFVAVGEGSIRAIDVLTALEVKVPYKTNKNKLYSLFDRIITRTIKDGVKLNVKMFIKNRFKISQEILAVLYRYAIDVTYFKAWSSPLVKKGNIKTKLVLGNFEEATKMLDELEKIDDVYNVQTYSSKGIIFFYFMSVLTSIVWIMHPFLLNWLVHSGWTPTNSFIVEIFFYAAIFLLVFLILYLTKIIKINFPLIRDKRLLWFTSFTVSTIAVVVLAIELIYLDLQLSRLVIMAGIVLMYFNLGLNYYNSRKGN